MIRQMMASQVVAFTLDLGINHKSWVAYYYYYFRITNTIFSVLCQCFSTFALHHATSYRRLIQVPLVVTSNDAITSCFRVGVPDTILPTPGRGSGHSEGILEHASEAPTALVVLHS